MSPVTQLPGNGAIEEELHGRMKEGRKFAVCYIDLDNFSAYNDHFGFHSGTEVIKMTGELLGDVLGERGGDNDFAGHAGGDNFVVFTSIELAEPLCSAIISVFDERIRSHYGQDDLENGFIPGTDLGGRPIIFPIMTISISVVHNEYRTLTDPAQIERIAAQLKKYARDLEGSVCVVDRRRA